MFEIISDDELNKKWNEAIGMYRYYNACDCPSSWKREEKARKQNQALLESLKQEFMNREKIPSGV